MMEPTCESRDVPVGSPFEPRLSVCATVDRIAASIARCVDLRTLTAEIVASMKQLVGADGAAVFLAESDGGLSCDLAAGGAEEGMVGVRLAPGEGIAGWCVRERMPIAVADVLADTRFTPRVDGRTGYRTRTAAAVPLIIAGDLVGVLEVVNKKEGVPFDETDLDVLRSLAPHVAVALNNAKLTEALRKRADDLETELERRMGQIIHAKREWEATIDAFPDPILLVDPNRRVKRANMATARRAGLPIVAIPNRVCHEVAFGAKEPCEDCPLPSALEGRPAWAEIHIGKEIHHASHFPLEDGEKRVHAVACSYRDVTATKEMEHRLRNSERMASVGRLAAGIAHEVNNPLAFMMSNLRALQGYFEEMVEATHAASSASTRETKSPPFHLGAGGQSGAEFSFAELADDGMNLILECEAGANRIARIVRQLGAFAHDRHSTEETFPLGHCVKRVRRQLETEFSGASIEVRDQAKGKVKGCPTSFDRAIAAMTRNALQASPEHVLIRIWDEPGFVALAVEDRGPGIDAAIRSRVFEPFFTTRAIGDGMGLGLSVVYATANQHRGCSVAIKDVPGGGTSILLRVPSMED